MPVKKLKTPVQIVDNAIPNVHPVDELQSIREEIAMLQAAADELRDKLLAEGADLRGDMYSAVIVPSKRETLDRKALIEAFGAEVLAPYTKVTAYKTLKIVEN